MALLQVKYPSGARLLVRGDWQGLISLGQDNFTLLVANVAVILGANAAGKELTFRLKELDKGEGPSNLDGKPPGLCLDPRAVCMAGGEVIYSPKLWIGPQAGWVKEWMAEHPGWG